MKIYTKQFHRAFGYWSPANRYWHLFRNQWEKDASDVLRNIGIDERITFEHVDNNEFVADDNNELLPDAEQRRILDKLNGMNLDNDAWIDYVYEKGE